ncbi:MAG: VanW family protein [Oscillospiraceae bacterium]|nr:VanW family protein [Oscillospiraceae bacterium]
MAKGKFEAGNNNRPAWDEDPFAVKDKPVYEPEKRKVWPFLAAAAGVVVLVAGILVWAKLSEKTPVDSLSTSTGIVTTAEPQGMSRTELEQKANQLARLLNQDMVLTLAPRTSRGVMTEEPIEVVLPHAELDVRLDFSRLNADLDQGVGKEHADTYVINLRDYMTVDDAALQSVADHVAEEYGVALQEPVITLEDVFDDENEGGEDNHTADQELVIKTPSIGRSIRAEDVFALLKNAYESVASAVDPEATLRPTLTYEIQLPQKSVEVNDLWERYCKEPVEPTVDSKTGAVTDGKNGYGFDKDALTELLAAAKPGDEVRIRMTTLKPKADANVLRERLFKDVLGEAHTNHTAIWNRTTNLKLACEAIDGTIVMPGEVFSFNKVVGERTEEKGYKEAIAYVHGGESKPELGGGVCQVASSIYYSVLLADLKTVQREPHMYLVDYVPSGMDATIFWGYLDYKFENTSPYPIKIQASVHDGQVHIVLLGTEWKDYTVKLSYEVLETEPWKEVKKDVPKDGTYREGEVIDTPYTGYKIATYKTTYDKDGKKLERTQIAISRYKKRDKTIAHLVDNLPTEPTKPTTPPTQPTRPTTPPTQPTKPTTPPTQPTTPPTQPTTPPTQPTTPPTQPTTPPTQPTTPPTQPTTPPTEPTPPPTQPTTPPTQPTTPPTEPTPPPTQPTTPPTEPTTPPTEPPTPSESESSGD